jgi:cation diffusion facilitator CzcD-associated flavoprotein CzcO
MVKVYNWTVIGAGPAGIAVVGKLLDQGIDPNEIAWMDRNFAAGDFGTKWHSVSGNTKVALFLEYLRGAKTFGFDEAPHFDLHDVDPDETCPLGLVADPLLWITSRLSDQVHTYQTVARELRLSNRQWMIDTEQQPLFSKNVVLAVGAVPKKLSYPGLTEIPIQTVLNPQELSDYPLDGATIAVFGSSHSTMVALPNLLRTNAKRIINFYRGPLRYAIEEADWTLFDDTGLKGNAASWARENIDGTYPDRLDRCSTHTTEFDAMLHTCDHVVYTVGFERRQLPLTPQWGNLEYNPTNGILAPGLFGVGIAFPQYQLDPLGFGQFRVGLQKFMHTVEEVLPIWLQYTP